MGVSLNGGTRKTFKDPKMIIFSIGKPPWLLGFPTILGFTPILVHIGPYTVQHWSFPGGNRSG